MTTQMLSTALTLLCFGAIEITTKNETNTLRYTQYSPQTRVEIPQTEEEENIYNEKCVSESEVITIMPEDNDLSCFQYALEKILGPVGFEEEISFPGRLFSIFVEDYFEQTDNPQPNDLVIYTYDENELMMTHFAVVIDSNTVESKWGYSSEVRRHKLFNIPTTFGNAAWFYTLKKEYKGAQGKVNAIASIRQCLELQKKILVELQQGKPTALIKRLKKIAPQFFQN